MDALLVVFRLLKLALSRHLGMRARFVTSMMLELFGIALIAISPFLLKALVDEMVHGPASTVPLVMLVALFTASWAAPGLLSAVRSTQSTRIALAVGQALTSGALSEALPRAARARDGDTPRLLGALERLPFSLTIVMEGVVWSSIPLAFQVVISVAVAAGALPVTEVTVLVVVLIAFAVVSGLGAWRHQAIARSANAAASTASHTLGDIVRNGRRVVLNGNLDLEIETVHGALMEKGNRQIASAWSLARLSGLQFTALAAGLTGLLAISAVDVTHGRMTVGGFVLLQAYAMRVVLPLGSFGFIFSHAGEAIANIADVFRLQGNAQPTLGTQIDHSSVANLQATEVSFAYGPGLPGVRKLSVAFPPGSVSALVGANGSGKSTFAQLLAGLLTPQAGAILLDGTDLQALAPAQRHKRVLYVPQVIGLFNRTLAANGLYPPTELTTEDLRARLTSWRFNDAGQAIDLDAHVGELGERLSGGQVQKLELARVSGIKVPILILDESTSALDPASEIQVLEDLRKALAGRTTLIMITHRPAAAALADQVIWLSAGKIVAVNGHDVLLQQFPDYRALWTVERPD